MSAIKQLKKSTKLALRDAKRRWPGPVRLSKDGMSLLLFDSERARWIEMGHVDYKNWVSS